MNVEKGIKKQGEKYVVYVSLDPRKSKKEHTYSFYVGTLDTLEEARDIKSKAEEITTFCKGNYALEALTALKNQIADNRMTKKKAADILKNLIGICEGDKEKQALRIAIRCLER